MIPFPTQAEKDAFLVRIKAHTVAVALDYVAAAPTHGVPSDLLQLAQQLACEVAFYQAIQPGVDLTSVVVDRWFLWLLTEELREYTTSAPAAELYRQRLSRVLPSPGVIDVAVSEVEFAAIRAAESDLPEAMGVAVAACRHDILTIVSEALSVTTRPRMVVALLRIVSMS